MSNLVVARYLDGKLLKGTSLDVDPTRPTFHVRPAEGSTAEVKLKDLKALFFVRSLEGDMARHEVHALDPADPRDPAVVAILPFDPERADPVDAIAAQHAIGELHGLFLGETMAHLFVVAKPSPRNEADEPTWVGRGHGGMFDR